MCFGSSKPKTTVPPEPKKPTTFDFRAGADSLKQQQQQQMAAAQSQPQEDEFGSELGTSGTAPTPATY
jgi:hypothetical protein